SIDYVKESGRVMYVSFASAPGVTWPFAKNLFRGGTTEVPRYGELYAEFIADHMQAQKVAVMNGREEYPKNEGDALSKQLQGWFTQGPFLPGSADPAQKAWEAECKQEYPSLTAGRPNIFDILSYGDMYVLAEDIRRAGPEPTTEKLVAALEGTQDYRVSGIAT